MHDMIDVKQAAVALGLVCITQHKKCRAELWSRPAFKHRAGREGVFAPENPI